MPDGETTYFQDDLATITDREAKLGPRTFLLENIHSASVKKIDSSFYSQLFYVVIGLAAIFSLGIENILDNLFFVSMLFIPIGFYILVTRPRYAILLTRSERKTLILATKDRRYLQKVSQKLNQALKENPPPKPPSFTASSAGGTFTPQVPSACVKCGAPIGIAVVVWQDSRTANCPTCNSSVEVTWRKVE